MYGEILIAFGLCCVGAGFVVKYSDYLDHYLNFYFLNKGYNINDSIMDQTADL